MVNNQLELIMTKYKLKKQNQTKKRDDPIA